jgi:uncharacterized protein
VEDDMTPQERQLIDDLFSRLEQLEATPRDPDAESAILQGLRRAPNATYALVQTVLLQDEALKRAGARIEELEAQGQPQQENQNQGSFLDSLRGSLFGSGTPQSRGSVPNVPPSASGDSASRPVWNSGQVLGRNDPNADPRYANAGYANAAPGYGGAAAPGYGGAPAGGPSFLGTAAATAAGVIGGSLLMNSIRGLGSGLGNHQSLTDSSAGTSPWSTTTDSNNSLSKDAGVNDIGKNAGADTGQRQDSFDQAQADADQDSDQDQDDDDDFAGGDFDSDDSDYA